VRSFDRRVGPRCAHSDSHVRLREGGRVADAVADHGDDAALALQGSDRADLVFRKHVGLELDPELHRNRLADLTHDAGRW